MNVYIDFLGYHPNTTYLIMSEDNPEKWLFTGKKLDKLRKKISQEKWNIIPNPRFEHFPVHIKLVEELKNGNHKP